MIGVAYGGPVAAGLAVPGVDADCGHDPVGDLKGPAHVRRRWFVYRSRRRLGTVAREPGRWLQSVRSAGRPYGLPAAAPIPRMLPHPAPLSTRADFEAAGMAKPQVLALIE